MFTEPDGLPVTALARALRDSWGFSAISLEYQPVGFGSYHWLGTDATGGRVFATVDDLSAKKHTANDTTDDAFDRLRRALRTALALRAEAGLTFVIAPLLTATGRVTARLSDRYSLVVHPYVMGTAAGENGRFSHDRDRQQVVDMLIQVHRAHVGNPRVDDFSVPLLDTLEAMIRQPAGAWCGGPYAQRSQELLRTHADDLQVLIAAYRGLARRVGSQRERMVITHGEPHAGNVLVTTGGLVLVDWDTILVAPPERDLCDLAEDDVSLLDRYSAATGIEIDDEALSLYRLWFDLAEIGQYLNLFRSPHEETADTRESWKNLQEFLRPAERWPALVERGKGAS